MTRFRFSLQPLLDHRRRELRQLEARCAREAGLASIKRAEGQRLIAELAAGASVEAEQWLGFHESSRGVQALATQARLDAAAHDEARRELLVELSRKQREVESLKTLEQRERDEHQQRSRRREDVIQADSVLRGWRKNHPVDPPDG